MKRKVAFLAVLGMLAALCGCAADRNIAATAPAQMQLTQIETVLDPAEMFSQRDLAPSYEEDGSAFIALSGSSASCSSDAVQIQGSTVKITDEGTYILTGQLDDGMIIVDAQKEDKTQLVFRGVTVHSQTSAALYVRQADKVFLTLEGENNLSSGETYKAVDENNIDAALFSKEDLSLGGTGSLTVLSPGGHGIISKDDLVITGGKLSITAAGQGIGANNSIRLANADVQIASGKDGIHAEHDEDVSLGYVYMESGNYGITCEGDGISASGPMQITGGTVEILAGGGSENGQQHTSDNWGNMPGGGMPGGGMPGGGMPGGGGRPGRSTGTSEDSASIKGIKATGAMVISGGSFRLNCADDAVHGNSTVGISGGDFTIKTGDDGVHADQALTVTGGKLTVSESYEGLEGLSISISGGEHSLISDDDGLNAAGGTDGSGYGGHRGGEQFSQEGGNASFIAVSGGQLYIQASGDGIDANGYLLISGGYVTVCGPTQGDTAVLDYDSTATITGGTFIGTGSNMMAQTFSTSEQGVIALRVGNQSAGTRVQIKNGEGTVLIDHTPELNYAIVILSCPEMAKGESYTVVIGSYSETFVAD